MVATPKQKSVTKCELLIQSCDVCSVHSSGICRDDIYLSQAYIANW